MRLAPWLLATVALAMAGCGEDGGGDDAIATKAPEDAARIRLSSPAFVDGSRLPKEYTCDGAGTEPLMQAGTVPASTKELILTVVDPDAPSGSFVHVTRFGLSHRGQGTVSEGGTEGRNTKGTIGWTPPCPPRGDRPHRYVWTVYALRDASDLERGAEPAEVGAVVEEGVLARGTITATYGRE